METSCDDTSVAVVENGNRLVANHVSGQLDAHRRFGGIVPEGASRKHLELLLPLLDDVLHLAGIDITQIDGYAATAGPGLTGSLLMGMCCAKVLALVYDRPFIGVNHLEGHLFAPRLEQPDIQTPFVSLLVSGGHTSLYAVKEWGHYRLLGKTRDDAAGEAYDKVAKYLGLGWPGGPIIDEMAQEGNSDRFFFRGGLEEEASCDFSFSGIKTAVVRTFKNLSAREQKDTALLHDLAASFQEAVIRTLVKKTWHALLLTGYKQVVVGGGVAANRALRERIKKKGENEGYRIFFPSLSLCTDNAAMIAACGDFHLSRGERSPLTLEPDPRLPLGPTHTAFSPFH